MELQRRTEEDAELARALACLATPPRLALLRAVRTPLAVSEIRVEGGDEDPRLLARRSVKEHLARPRPAAEPAQDTATAPPRTTQGTFEGPCLVLAKGLEEGCTFRLDPPAAQRTSSDLRVDEDRLDEIAPAALEVVGVGAAHEGAPGGGAKVDRPLAVGGGEADGLLHLVVDASLSERLRVRAHEARYAPGMHSSAV